MKIGLALDELERADLVAVGVIAPFAIRDDGIASEIFAASTTIVPNHYVRTFNIDADG